MQEVRMEKDAFGPLRHSGHGLVADNLVRCNTDNCLTVKVVLGLTLVDDTAFGLLQKQ